MNKDYLFQRRSPMPENRRVALYARVSDPRDGRQHPEIQLEELRHYATRRGWRITREYVDRITGTKDSRPQLNQLMLDARARKFDLALVWRLDRLGRSLRHLVNTASEFEALGIGLVSLRESLDPTTPMGKAMFGMIAVMAEFERELIRERVLAGMRHAKSRGIHLGRPKVEADGDVIRSMRKSGVAWREIAERLGVSVGTAIGRIRPS
jgi:DNA invertase Pin-like site-specific DNA recombinase